jgi:hypothetical protein
MTKYIVTDLTRFSNTIEVCTALIDTQTGICYRPLPYFSNETCKKHNLHPGGVFSGNFKLKGAEAPHIEDAAYSGLEYHGPCSKDDFQAVLNLTLVESISEGFSYNFEYKQKHLPLEEKPDRSIITIKVAPHHIEILEDQYKPGKIKCSITDSDGHYYGYLAITDRGFFDYAQTHRDKGTLDELNHFLSSQDEIYLRIGLSRAHKVGERNGYWLQVNGIYTFPDFLEKIRTYI